MTHTNLNSFNIDNLDNTSKILIIGPDNSSKNVLINDLIDIINKDNDCVIIKDVKKKDIFMKNKKIVIITEEIELRNKRDIITNILCNNKHNGLILYSKNPLLSSMVPELRRKFEYIFVDNDNNMDYIKKIFNTYVSNMTYDTFINTINKIKNNPHYIVINNNLFDKKQKNKITYFNLSNDESTNEQQNNEKSNNEQPNNEPDNKQSNDKSNNEQPKNEQTIEEIKIIDNVFDRKIEKTNEVPIMIQNNQYTYLSWFYKLFGY